MVKPIVCRQKGVFMISQPKDGSRNVNNTFYKFEAKMIEKLNTVLGEVELTKAEEKTLIWLAGWEECTIDHLVSVIEKVARKRAEEGGGYALDKSDCRDSRKLGE
ncbi:MAG: hypothetical protein RSD28_03830 [Lachnospiraceae bacterium]